MIFEKARDKTEWNGLLPLSKDMNILFSWDSLAVTMWFSKLLVQGREWQQLYFRKCMVTHYFFSGSSQLSRVAFHATVCNDINSMPHGNVRKNEFHLFLYPGMDVFLISGEACAVYFISLWDGKIFSFQSASVNFPSPFPYMIQFFEPLKLKGGERCILFWVRLVIVCLSVCPFHFYFQICVCTCWKSAARVGSGRWH